MRSHLAAAARFLAAPTAALVFVLAFAPGRAELATRVYALVACGTLLAIALVALRRAFPPEQPLRGDARVEPARRRPPPSLARIEHEAALGVAGSFDLHFRLVPRLRAVADGLLESRRRISLEHDPAAARAIVGETAWPLVRPDRSPPDDRLARGLPPDELLRAVESLETI